MSAPEESKDTTEAAPAEKIEIDEVNSANQQINYDFWFIFFCLIIVITNLLLYKFFTFSLKNNADPMIIDSLFYLEIAFRTIELQPTFCRQQLCP